MTVHGQKVQEPGGEDGPEDEGAVDRRRSHDPHLLIILTTRSRPFAINS